MLSDADDLDGFESMGLEPGVSVVQAEDYGRGGELLAHAGTKTGTSDLEKLLSTGLERFDARAKDVRAHIREGEREGIEWEPAIPVSDPGRRR